MKRALILTAAALAAASPAAAHVVIAPERAEAGSYFAASFRAGHGCQDQATTAIRIEIPKGIASAKPRAIPGFRLHIERAGKEWDSPVTAITWTGRVPDDQFQAYEVLMKLPAQTGAVYFPVVQTCGKLTAKWIEVPTAGGESPSRPAPRLDIMPAGAPVENHSP